MWQWEKKHFTGNHDVSTEEHTQRVSRPTVITSCADTTTSKRHMCCVHLMSTEWKTSAFQHRQRCCRDWFHTVRAIYVVRYAAIWNISQDDDALGNLQIVFYQYPTYLLSRIIINFDHKNPISPFLFIHLTHWQTVIVWSCDRFHSVENLVSEVKAF